MDKDKKTDGSLSSGDFVSNDFLIRQGCGRSRDVVINNFSNEIGLKWLAFCAKLLNNSMALCIEKNDIQATVK